MFDFHARVTPGSKVHCDPQTGRDSSITLSMYILEAKTELSMNPQSIVESGVRRSYLLDLGLDTN